MLFIPVSSLLTILLSQPTSEHIALFFFLPQEPEYTLPAEMYSRGSLLPVKSELIQRTPRCWCGNWTYRIPNPSEPLLRAFWQVRSWWVARKARSWVWEGLFHPDLSLTLTSELSWIPLDGFCHMNQQGRELARGRRVDQLGRILIMGMPPQWECWRYHLPVWACTLASRCGPDATLFFHSEKQPSVATVTKGGCVAAKILVYLGK